MPEKDKMNLPTHMSGQFSGQVPNQSGTSLSSVSHQQNVMQTSRGQRNTLNADTDFMTVRRYIQDRIYEFLMCRQTRELEHKKVMDIVRRLEEGLFKTATTKEEYMNSETLEIRLHALIKCLPYSNHNQHQQQGNTSVPMGTMIPNPGMPQSGDSSIMVPSSMDATVPPAVNTGNFLPNGSLSSTDALEPVYSMKMMMMRVQGSWKASQPNPGVAEPWVD
ncbi:hypothetical protein E3N88_39200 [Mikania micrantha]|uniref:Uncharacterized protein n=1 Tax=Mikania micrantha TaxID=192012 RepID=A0A5N6LW32_9ASTR|nr:hypothetical protein E3N88_39200 [Mikania micrantha]